MKSNDAKRGIDRRTLLKYTAATGAAAATGTLGAPAIAQAKPIKIGYVSPATGPLAAFAAADQFMLKQFMDAT
ncbi:MAG: twin-arginine translocation signal domain-containing protein, partial [Rhodoplanes sp.]